MSSIWSLIWRGARWAAIVVLVIVFAVAVLGYHLSMRSAPEYARTHVLVGPRAEVEIVRDANAVPHIFAETEYDAYFALGFVHAQDRLWQMELRRRLAQGRISELAGGFASYTGQEDFLLRVDVTMRALDLYGHAQRSLEYQTPEIRRALSAYAAGVNSWLDTVDREALGKGAPELMLFGAEVEAWKPEDALAAFKMLAATLSGSPFAEIRATRYLIEQGAERAEDLFPQPPNPAVTALPPFASLFGEAVEFADAGAGEGGLSDWPHGLNAADYAGASNAWAVSGARSAAGAPIVASDPHLPLSAPSVWYLASLRFPDGGVIGGTIAGIPAILAGRNEQLAWAPTTLYADTADFFMETVNPDYPNLYETPDGWAPFDTRQEIIRKADGSAVEVTLKRSRHGPVLPLDWRGIAAITPADKAPALSWTLLTDEDRSLAAVMELMRAGSVEDAIALVPMVVSPPQLVTLADKNGVALIAAGQVPKRSADSKTRGRVASPGWRPENDWLGVRHGGELPRAVNPASGAVANANNKITDAPYPDNLGFEWPEPYRIERLSKLLNNREYHSLRSFQAIQTDTVSEMARAVLPLLAGELWRQREQESGLRREALDLLAEWNGAMDPYIAEPLIFSAWARATVRRLTAERLGPLAASYEGLRPLFLERVFRDVDGAAERWCVAAPDEEERGEQESSEDEGADEAASMEEPGDPTEPAEASVEAAVPPLLACRAIADAALSDALKELSEAYGPSIERWRWGKAHRAVHRHQPLSGSGLGFLFDITQDSPGGDHTLFRGQTPGRGATPYANVHAGGFRAIYDFADLDRSVVAISTGQSGHFLSRHYDDFAEVWRSGDYVPLSLDRQDAQAGAVGVTRLIPEE